MPGPEGEVCFHPNISILYTEVPFLDRFHQAAGDGFRTVEFWWPLDEDLDAVAGAVQKAGLGVDLINFYGGNLSLGDRGVLSDPARQHLFRENVPVALALARRIGCSKLNALVGQRLPTLTPDEQMSLALKNVAWTADQASAMGADILIEAINTIENGPYLLPTTREAAEFVSRVNRRNVKLQYDVYHMQRMEGNLLPTMETYMPAIGHIQIADAPYRSQPGTGEINFRVVLRAISRLGFRGSIGLEYRPLGTTTEDSLRWLPKRLRGTWVSVEELDL